MSILNRDSLYVFYCQIADPSKKGNEIMCCLMCYTGKDITKEEFTQYLLPFCMTAAKNS